MSEDKCRQEYADWLRRIGMQHSSYNMERYEGWGAAWHAQGDRIRQLEDILRRYVASDVERDAYHDDTTMQDSDLHRCALAALKGVSS